MVLCRGSAPPHLTLHLPLPVLLTAMAARHALHCLLHRHTSSHGPVFCHHALPLNSYLGGLSVRQACLPATHACHTLPPPHTNNFLARCVTVDGCRAGGRHCNHAETLYALLRTFVSLLQAVPRAGMAATNAQATARCAVVTGTDGRRAVRGRAYAGGWLTGAYTGCWFCVSGGRRIWDYGSPVVRHGLNARAA